jgi:phytoene synthase
MSHQQKGYQKAKLITRQYATTFYAASRFLPREKRLAAYAVYAVCRISDDSIDLPQNPSLSPIDSIKAMKIRIHTAYTTDPITDNLLAAFKDTVTHYAIPERYFTELLAGMEMDITQNRYSHFDELYTYCYRVAGIVGLIMLKIFGASDPKAESSAVELGVALQLTNIIRDIKEDLERGRIYLPQEDMQRFGVTEADIAGHRLNDNFKKLLQFEITRARQYYHQAVKGIRLIGDKRGRLVALAIKELYAAILEETEKNNYDIFSRRLYVKPLKRCSILLKIILRGDSL